MRPSTIWYTLKQGIINIKRNWMFSLASILTMAACIFLVGVFYSLVTNVDNIAHKVEQEVPVTVFFDEGTTQEQMEEVGNLIQARPEVERIEFESAEQAWENFKDQYFQGSDAANGFRDDNPLVNSANYHVYLNQIEKQTELVSYIQGLEHVREVNQSEKAANTLGNFNKLVSYASMIIIAILLIISIFQQYCFGRYCSPQGGDRDHEIYRCNRWLCTCTVPSGGYDPGTDRCRNPTDHFVFLLQ